MKQKDQRSHTFPLHTYAPNVVLLGRGWLKYNEVLGGWGMGEVTVTVSGMESWQQKIVTF